MKISIFCAALVLVSVSMLLGGENVTPNQFKVRPVQVISCDILPAEAAMISGFMQHKPGFQVFYLIEGTDLIGIKKGSLHVDSIKTSAGKDISKKRNGTPAYEQGAFPRTSDDGKFCVFSIDVKDHSQFGQVEKVSLNGSVVVLLGSNQEEKTIVLDVEDKKEIKVGPFTVKAGKGQAGGIMAGFGALFGAPTPQSDDKDTSDAKPDFVGITLSGPLDSIIDVKFKDGKKPLQTCFSYTDTSRSYNFPKPKSGKLTLAIRYWTDVREATVRFGSQP